MRRVIRRPVSSVRRMIVMRQRPSSRTIRSSRVPPPALRSFLRGDGDAPEVARPGLRAVRVLRQHTGRVGLNLGPGLPVDPGTERRPNARPAELLTNAPVWALGDGRLVVLCRHVTDERTTRFARST